MLRRPPRSTLTDTLFPCTTLFRSAFDEVVAVPVYPAPHGSGGLARSFGAGAQRRGEFAIGEGVGAECRAIGLSRGGRTPDGGTVRPGGRAADPGCQSSRADGPA